MKRTRRTRRTRPRRRPYFKFFSLPQELRNTIYELLLVTQEDGVIVASSDHPYVIIQDDAPLGDRHLLQALPNREFRDEAYAVFYGRNNWLFTTPADIIPFSRQKPSAREFMKHASIWIGAFQEQLMKKSMQRPWVLGFRYMARHVRLQRLHLTINYDNRMFSVANEPGQNLFDSGKGFVPFLFALVRITELRELEVDMRRDWHDAEDTVGNARLKEQEGSLTAELVKKMVGRKVTGESRGDTDADLTTDVDDSCDEQSDEDTGENEIVDEDDW
ncbi:hypothetical protein MMC30_002831 [Trapelia coarctata]|nr:hypothetical protein [Trapelia coarctata]